MRRDLLLACAIGLVVLALGVGAATYVGGDPIADTPRADEPTDEPPTATPDGSDAGTAPSSFAFTIDRVEECGRTCRDVTVTLHNTRNATVTEVTVYTRIYAGRDNTADGDVVWDHRRDVGTLDAEEAYTTTERVELSLREGFEIERHDGWITVLTTVESELETVTFRDTMQVA